MGNKSIPVVNIASAADADKLQVRLYVKKSLKQSQIRISELGIARSDKDYLALRLGNEIVGGSFASRLNQKVRDDLGLTYSISSQFLVRKEKGSFSINTFSKNETAGKTFEESMKVIEDVLKGGVNEKEVNAGISQLLGQFPRSIETSDKLALNLLVLNYFGIQFDYLVNFNATVQSLNVETVNNALRKNLNPSKFKAVIYGNESIIPQFEKYHPEIIELP